MADSLDINLQQGELVELVRVNVESPFAGNLDRNLRYARRAMLDSLNRDEAPFLSHLLYTQVLNDSDPEQRAHGIAAGFAYLVEATKVVFYLDYGMSEGMQKALEVCEKLNLPTEFRYIGTNEREDQSGSHHIH